MAFTTVFKRYELKYMLTDGQKARLFQLMSRYMKADRYPKSTIRNVYFDTYSYRLIRRSIEHPPYKEKLRLRSYERARPDSAVFVELKKKYDHVVYKRRLFMTEDMATEWISRGAPIPCNTQIGREIEYFKSFYGGLLPRVFLSYDREAFVACDGSDLRITLDTNILARTNELSLACDPGGEELLEDGLTLMEIKTSGAIPLWLCRFLSREGIYKTSFSKYGTAYKKLIFNTSEANNYGKPV